MKRSIIQGTQIFANKAVPATKKDQQDIIDLRDTFIHNANRAAGLAANMIGSNKRIIVFGINQIPVIMVNPKITSHSSSYQATEGCLSLQGERSVTRYQEITVNYLDENFKQQTGKFHGFVAEVIQHEIDHCEGKEI